MSLAWVSTNRACSGCACLHADDIFRRSHLGPNLIFWLNQSADRACDQVHLPLKDWQYIDRRLKVPFWVSGCQRWACMHGSGSPVWDWLSAHSGGLATGLMHATPELPCQGYAWPSNE